MKMYSRYSHPVSSGMTMLDDGITQQHFAHDVNMHEIIERSKRGIFPNSTDQRAPIFGDFSTVTDYQSAVEAFSVSEEAFMSLSPDVRIRFNNDPGELLAFVGDANNKAEAIRLGLVEAPVEAPRPLVGDVVPASVGSPAKPA